VVVAPRGQRIQISGENRVSLIVPQGPQWAHYTDNFSLTADAASQGTALTVAANNTKGSVTTLLTALAHDVEHVRLGFSNFSSSGINRSSLADIMIDPGGGTNWSVLIPNLAVGISGPVNYSGATQPAGVPLWLEFPLWIPAGASLGVRAQTADASNFTARVYIQTRGGNRNPGAWWCGQWVTALGIDAANSRGMTITPVQQPSWSAWANIGAALDVAAGAVQTVIQGEGDDTMVSATHFCQLGANSVAIGPAAIKGLSSGETGFMFPQGLVFAGIPAGTQLQVRGSWLSSGTGQPVDVAVYCVS
jgi:hypothetical protein